MVATRTTVTVVSNTNEHNHIGTDTPQPRPSLGHTSPPPPVFCHGVRFTRQLVSIWRVIRRRAARRSFLEEEPPTLEDLDDQTGGWPRPAFDVHPPYDEGDINFPPTGSIYAGM
jgi:hypothetical protein